MPQVKSTKSLKELCFHFILENQDFFCKRFTLQELLDGTEAMDSDEVNSLIKLPTVLLEELTRILRDIEMRFEFLTTFRTEPLLELSMIPHFHTLELTRMKKGTDISDILYLTTIKNPVKQETKNFETLQLDSSTCHYQYICNKGNFNFIPKFKKLRILDVSFSEADDDCFHLIGKHCPDLRELYAKRGEVTDEGIRNLCVIGNCKSIRKLDLERCNKVTTKGIQLALDNLPQLRAFCHESLLEGLAEIAQSATDNKIDLPKYSLSTLYVVKETVYKSGSLQQSVLLCPNVTEVNLAIWREGLKDSELLSLLSLKQLYTIQVQHAIPEPLHRTEIRIERGLTFDGVVPLLKKFGYTLKNLRFEFFVVVDIPVITEFCSNLESLTLYCCKTTQRYIETEVERPRLNNLKKLIIGYLTISSEDLVALLASPSLLYVGLLRCDALNDNVFHRVSNLHSFRNLEHLYISNCNSVTKNGIEIFLQESNPLREIILCCSEQSVSRITRDDIANWNDTAIWIKKNWRFNFILKSYRRYIYLGGYTWKHRRGEF